VRFGGLGLLGLLIAIIVYAYFIAFNCQSQFGRLLVMGIVINFSLYIFINIFKNKCFSFH
jgi:cell division protein FtsW (lipid II flippase)